MAVRELPTTFPPSKRNRSSRAKNSGHKFTVLMLMNGRYIQSFAEDLSLFGMTLSAPGKYSARQIREAHILVKNETMDEAIEVCCTLLSNSGGKTHLSFRGKNHLALMRRWTAVEKTREAHGADAMRSLSQAEKSYSLRSLGIFFVTFFIVSLPSAADAANSGKFVGMHRVGSKSDSEVGMRASVKPAPAEKLPVRGEAQSTSDRSTGQKRSESFAV